MTSPILRSACLVVSILGLVSFAMSQAQAVGPDQSKAEQAALITAQKNSKITLQDGIKSSEREGTPISAKFEMEDDRLQFSAYTTKGNDFTEVVVDPESGAIKSAEKITDPDDLAAAKAQKSAMDKATMSLSAAAEKAAKDKTDGRLISAIPELKDGQPFATVVLVGTDGLETISQKLN